MLNIVEELKKRNVILSDEEYERYSQTRIVKKLAPIFDILNDNPKEQAKLLQGMVREISVTIADYLMFDYLKGEIEIDEEFEEIIQCYAYVNTRLVRINLGALGL